MGLFSKILPWLGGGLFSKSGKNFLTGTPGKYKELSTLTDAQQPLQQQLINAGLGQGAGGAFGSASDYYRDLLSNDSQTAQMMFAPEMRQFNEDIIPGLAEQFAGMGSGGLSSSGFRNAGVQAATDLSERLGAIRAQLRGQGAAGLANIGAMGLNPVKENIYEAGQPGFLDQALPMAGNAAAMYFGAPPIFGQNQQKQPSKFGMNSFGGQNVGKKTSPYGIQGANAANISGLNMRGF